LKNKDSASYYAYAALELAKQKNLKKELTDAYSALFDYHNTFGDYKKALEYRLIYDSLYNETVNSNVSQSSERTRIKLEQEKKDLMAQRDQEIKDSAARRSRNLQYGIIGGFMLLASLLLWNNRQKQKAKLKIEQAYGQLKSTQSQLIQSEKMASLGELTAGIAHEIQNPLNFVNNFSEVNNELIEELKSQKSKLKSEEQDEILNDIFQNNEKINHHGKRADAIVKGMLQHSRSSSGVKEPTDINALCDEYLRLSYHGLRAKDKSFNATMKTDFDKSIGDINIIPQDIGRVVLNLLTNSFYAVNERLRQAQPDSKFEPTVTISTRLLNPPSGGRGAKVEIKVTDNGNGIPPKVLDKIFQPFFTTKPTGQGTGLGLSLSYDIIKAHGGEIKVESKENEGTTFIIQLPII
jgi:signal transduction histidine kinase